MVHLRANDVIREAKLDRYVSILSLFLNIPPLFFFNSVLLRFLPSFVRGATGWCDTDSNISYFIVWSCSKDVCSQ